MNDGIIQKIASYFNVTPSQINVNFEEANETARLEQSQKLYDYYNGNSKMIEHHLLATLSKTFDKYTIQQFQLAYIPLMRTIIDKLCMVYQGDVKRYLDDETKNDKLFEIYKESDIEQKQINWYKLGKTFHTVLVQPIVREIDGEKRLQFEIWTPNKISVVPKKDNYLLPEIIKYDYQTIENDKPAVYSVYWSDTQHFVTDVDGNKLNIIENNLEGVNPYGVLPFVVLRFKETENFWGEGETVLLNMEEKVNVLLTQLMDNAIMQSHGQAFFDNVRIGEEIKTGARYPIVAERRNPDQPATLEFKTVQSKMTELQSSIDWLINRVMTMYGLSHTSTQGQSQVASGYAKLIDNWDVIEKRYEDIGILTDFEIRLFKIVQKVVKHEMGIDLGDEDIKITFANYEYPEDPKMKIEVKKIMLELGLWTPVDDMIAEDSSLSEEMAMDKIKKNIEIKNRLKDEFGLYINNNGADAQGENYVG